MNITKLYIAFATSLFAITAYTQNISKEVHVTSSFRPEIEQAEKVNHLPEVNDTVAVKPATDIIIMPSQIKTAFDVRPIKPAKIVSNPLDKLYNSYLKLGLGNHLTPLAEFNIQNLRSKKYSYGGYFLHRSSNQKDIELTDNVFVSDDYSKNALGGYGKIFLNKHTVNGDMSFNSHAFHYYGLNTEQDLSNLPNDFFNKQRFSNFKFNAGIQSSKPDSTAFHYFFKLNTNYFYTKENNKEGRAGFSVGAGQYIGSFLTNLTIDYNNAKYTPESGVVKKNSTLNFNPSVKKRKEEWEFKIGANITHNTLNDTSKLYFYPDAYLRFYVLPEILQVFFGVEGNLEENYFSKVTRDNPYLSPEFSFLNTNHQIIGYGGIMGKISSKGGYKIDVRFDAMENNYFYVLEPDMTSPSLDNRYINVKDNTDLISLTAEFNYKPLSNLEFLFVSQFNNYKVVEQDYAWLMPKFKSNFSTRYNFSDKIYTSLDIIYIGKRNARKPITTSIVTEELPAIFDINLSGEYKYSKVLSFFIDFNNILGNKYEFWHNYPTQGFQVMAGLSYKL